MSLESILSACKTINAAITGITASYTYSDVPESLATASLPCAIARPDSGDISYQAATLARIDHRVRIWVIGDPVGQGSAAARLAALVPFLARFRDAYAASVKLGVSTVSHAMLTSYAFKVLEYAGASYAVLELILSVTEKETVRVS